MLLQEMTWPAIKSLSKDLPIVIPIAAVEQHGYHMPLDTDSRLLGEIVSRAHERLPETVVVTPLMWLGNSHHHLDFAGTLSSEPRVYLDLLSGLLNNLIGHGFRRLLLLNGHGGNDVPGKQVVFETRQKHRGIKDILIMFTTYWSLGSEPHSTFPTLRQKEMGHACEWETSMMLRIAPHLVGDYQSATDIPHGNPFLPAFRGWLTQERSLPGHIGYPRFATAEKGEHLLALFSRDVYELIGRIRAWDGSSWDG
jgi:creatinine amidohydrolase